VIIDNAFNGRSMGDSVMKDYPSIVWTSCVPHYIFIKDITKLPWVKYVFNKIKHVNFVMKKLKFLAIYMTFQDLEFLKFSKTKYAYLFLVLERLLKVYPIFKKMIICDAWQAWQAWQDIGTPKAKRFKILVLVDFFGIMLKI
jgi:hypothetical protein